MKDLQLCFNRCLDKVTALGITPGNITKVEINTRAKKRWGLCTRKPSGIYIISISDRALKDSVPDDKTEEIIIHEILHSCFGGLNHGKEWQRLAKIVNNAYGYNISRLVNAADYNEKPYKKLPAKYIITCTGCGVSTTRCKESKLIQQINKYHCKYCGSKLKVDFA